MKRLCSLFALALLGMTACKSPPAPTVTVVGLWPQDPSLRLKGADSYEWPSFDTARPTLRWEAFPRPADLASDATGLLADLKSVTYDLRIWREGGGRPAALAYSRDALPTAAHQVEQPLAPDTWYFWTIRARFEIKGGIRVTPWSRIHFPAPAGVLPYQGNDTYPNARSYRFRIR